MKSGIDYIGTGCGAIVIRGKKEVLLVQRSKVSRTEPGTWSRPGGEVDFGESIKAAVARETLEETGVVVKAEEEALLINEIITKDSHWMAHGYVAEYISGEAYNVEGPEKHEDVKWFPLDNLPQNLNIYTKESLEKYIATRL